MITNWNDLEILLNSISCKVDYQVVCAFETYPMPLKIRSDDSSGDVFGVFKHITKKITPYGKSSSKFWKYYMTNLLIQSC